MFYDVIGIQESSKKIKFETNMELCIYHFKQSMLTKHMRDSDNNDPPSYLKNIKF